MATNTQVTLEPFKRGDTPTFLFTFTSPYDGFDWSGITADIAMTKEPQPSDNSGAAAVRLAQALTPDDDGAYYQFILTEVESKALTPGTNYNVEMQLRQGGTSVTTPATAKVKVLQDYVI